MMKSVASLLAVIFCVTSLSLTFSEDAASSARNPPETAVARPTVAEARRQAEVLHTAVHAALRSVHDRYYREDKGLPIPAVVLKDIFAELEQEQQITLRWLAVEGQAMNTDHKPQNAMETEAVRVLKSKQSAQEWVVDGVYRRAGAITLSNHCLKCHVPDRKSTENRIAGLIIAIPIAAE